MDAMNNEVRQLRFDEYDSGDHLRNAAKQARQRNYQDFLIVDVDAHHYESEHYREVFYYIENPVIRRDALESFNRGGRSSFLGGQVGYQDIGGRITRHWLRKHEKTAARASSRHHHDAALDGRDGRRLCLPVSHADAVPRHASAGRDRSARWRRPTIAGFATRSSPHEPRIISMLYLPFNDPEAAYRTVKEFGGRKGVSRLHGDGAALQAGARQRLHEDLSRCSRKWACRSPSMPPITGTTSRCR